MTKKITLEELMLPLIDDAANVFYSKLVSILDALWGQSFVYKAWCGWHKKRILSAKWKYGAFSSYSSDRKCLVALNDIPLSLFTEDKMYLRAVYSLDLSKILVDTTESISNTGGAPVPTYRIDADYPIKLLGFSLTTKKDDVLYGGGAEAGVCLTTEDGRLKEIIQESKIKRPFISFLLGEVANMFGKGVQFNPIYSNGMLSFDEQGFNLNKGNTIYSVDTPMASLPDLTKTTKYEWDCGRVLEYSTGEVRPRYWIYYSLDSEGSLWELERSDREESSAPKSTLPFLSALYGTDYFKTGAFFKTEKIGLGEYRVFIWKVQSNACPKDTSELCLRMSPYKMPKFIEENGVVTQEILPRKKTARLGRLARKVIYASHVPALNYIDFFKDALDNSILLTATKNPKSLYNLEINSGSGIVAREISFNYLLMLVLAVSNVSAHYLFSSTSLDYRLASPTHIDAFNERRRLSANEVLLYSKYSICSPHRDDSGSTLKLKWQNIWTPYVFVLNGDSKTYKTRGGTLCKFVNLGTKANPKFYRVDRTSTIPDDYGEDRTNGVNPHVFNVSTWSPSDINEYAPTRGLDMVISGYYMEEFKPYDPSVSYNKLTQPTRNLSIRWSNFIKSLARITETKGFIGSPQIPNKKACSLDPASFGIFLRQNTTGLVGAGVKFDLKEINGSAYLVLT